jgi:hypothetical protein
MIELLRYLEGNGFATFVTSGGDRDFMRSITDEVDALPPERAIGSSNGLRYQEGDAGGSIVMLAEPDVFDDGPVKPDRIRSRTGRRPILAGGNSNGDVPMLAWAGTANAHGLSLPIKHDDAEREFDSVTGAEAALERAAEAGWTVVSIKDDWATVFAEST